MVCKPTYNVDAGDKESWTWNSGIEHLIGQETILTIERETLHDASSEILKSFGREAIL